MRKSSAFLKAWGATFSATLLTAEKNPGHFLLRLGSLMKCYVSEQLQDGYTLHIFTVADGEKPSFGQVCSCPVIFLLQ